MHRGDCEPEHVCVYMNLWTRQLWFHELCLCVMESLLQITGSSTGLRVASSSNTVVAIVPEWYEMPLKCWIFKALTFNITLTRRFREAFFSSFYKGFKTSFWNRIETLLMIRVMHSPWNILNINVLWCHFYQGRAEYLIHKAFFCFKSYIVLHIARFKQMRTDLWSGLKVLFTHIVLLCVKSDINPSNLLIFKYLTYSTLTTHHGGV